MTKNKTTARRGRGWWDDVKGGIKKAVHYGRKAHDFVKENKLVSTIAPLMGHPEIGMAAGLLGYGKRKKQRRGRGPVDGAFDWMSDLASKVAGQKINSGDWQDHVIDWGANRLHRDKEAPPTDIVQAVKEIAHQGKRGNGIFDGWHDYENAGPFANRRAEVPPPYFGPSVGSDPRTWGPHEPAVNVVKPGAWKTGGTSEGVGGNGLLDSPMFWSQILGDGVKRRRGRGPGGPPPMSPEMTQFCQNASSNPAWSRLRHK